LHLPSTIGTMVEGLSCRDRRPRRSALSLPLEGSETATAVLNYSPVGCKTRGVTEPQRDRGTTFGGG